MCEIFISGFFHDNMMADDPFFCPEEVTRSYNALISSSNFDIIKPSHSSSRGGATVGYTIRTSSLNKALKYVAEDLFIQNDFRGT